MVLQHTRYTLNLRLQYIGRLLTKEGQGKPTAWIMNRYSLRARTTVASNTQSIRPNRLHFNVAQFCAPSRGLMVRNLNPAKLISGPGIGGDYNIACLALPVENDETGAGRDRFKLSRAEVQNARVRSARGPAGTAAAVSATASGLLPEPSFDSCSVTPYTSAAIPASISTVITATAILRMRKPRGVKTVPGSGVESSVMETAYS